MSKSSKVQFQPAYVEDAPDVDDAATKDQPPAPAAPGPPHDSVPDTTGVAKTDPATEPPAAINVFDFLVTDETPNASRVSLNGSKEPMSMVAHAPSVFEPSTALTQIESDIEDEDKEYDIAYEENGFSYGAGPIKPSLYPNEMSNISMDFMTPAPRKAKDKNRKKKDERDKDFHSTSDKKRKRGTIEDLDVVAANMHHDDDTPMADAPSSVANNVGTPILLNHSGLTGGLDRMLRDERSVSPDEEDDYTDDDQNRRRYLEPQSPLKRSRRNDNGKELEGGLGISIKGRAGKIMSMFGGSALSGSGSGGHGEQPSKALVRTRRSSSENENGHSTALIIRRPKKAPRVRHLHDGNHERSERKPNRKMSVHNTGNGHYELSRPSRKMKAIEYHHDSDQSRSRSRSRSRSPRGEKRSRDNENRQLIVYRHSKMTDEEMQREKALHFLSLVTKGPDSERGCSINKALKRFHRDYPTLESSEERDGQRRGRGHGRADREQKYEDEKELWRMLRLKRNDRGEVVVFF